jgi:hypothetical protein
VQQLVVYHTNVTSYSIIAREICRVNGWQCRYITGDLWLPIDVDAFIGSQFDAVKWHNVRPRRFAYITVEGQFDSAHAWRALRDLCDRIACYVPTQWGRAVLEAHNVRVQDVIPHALPEPVPGPPGERPLDVIYLNAYYRFYCRDRFGLLNQCDACERKGWRFWPEIRKAFPGSLGFVSNCEVVDGVVGFKAKDIVDVYRLLALGRVYAHLSTHEGFGLNPVMAAAMGTAVVSWDIIPTREILPEAAFVPARDCATCYLYPYDITARGHFTACWGSIDEFIKAVREVLKSSLQVDWQAVRQKFSAQKLYTRLA